MRDERNPEPLSGRPDRLRDEPSAIDRELADALAVEPSPDFVARVRMRVANEPAPRRAWLGWTTWMPVTAGALVAAAVAVAVSVGPLQKRGPAVGLPAPSVVEGKPDTTGVPVARGADIALAPAPAPTSVTPTSVTPTSVAPTSVASAVRPTNADRVRLKPDTTFGTARLKPDTTLPAPEVLISRAETEAFRRLLATAREGRVDLTALLKDTPEAGTDLQPSPEITIPRLTVDPIVPPTTNGEGVSQ